MTEPDVEIDLMELADLGQPRKLALEIHRQLRVQFGRVPQRVPLAGIAKAVGIVGIKEVDVDSFEGTLVVQGNAGAIGIRQGMPSGRTNFTIGHELGHFVIPAHRLNKTHFQCVKGDMRSERGAAAKWDQRPIVERMEVEANEFSAALLVPEPEFTAERRRLGAGCDVVHIRQLAELFDVSQEMMAQLYIKAADEKVAVITSLNGVVKRVMPCTGFPYLGLRGEGPIPTSSLTTEFAKANASGAVSELREVSTSTWLERKGSVSALFEQVFVQDGGWAMTLLSVEEEEIDEDEDDSNWNRRSGRTG